MRSRCIIVVIVGGLLVGLGTGSPEAFAEKRDPLEGALVSVFITGGFTPYLSVRYDVVWRSGVAVATHYRALVNHNDSLHRLRLVRRKDFTALLSKLKKMGVWQLKKSARPKFVMGGLTAEIEIVHGGRKHQFSVVDPAIQADSRYLDVFSTIRSFVLKKAGDLVFRNVFFEPGTFGYLNLSSVPVAKIRLDGKDIGMETPVYGYELKAGKHLIELNSSRAKGGYKRSHVVRIEPGVTTIIHLDLR